VHQGANRNIGKGEAIARPDFGMRSRNERVANLNSERSDDITLDTISVEKQRQAGSPVRIVLDGGYLGGDIMLLTLEIDDTNISAITTTAMADRDATGGIASTVTTRMNDQAALGGWTW
jgi:hypothetical protein